MANLRQPEDQQSRNEHIDKWLKRIFAVAILVVLALIGVLLVVQHG